MAAGRLLHEISGLPFVKLTAAADLRRQSLERFREEYDAEVYDSIEEMCQSPSVDAVYVATPHDFHARHTIIAAENGKHVIVEKPMALSIEEADAMNAAVERCGVKLMCGHTHSFDPPITEMRKIVRSGKLGRLFMINTSNYKDHMYRPWSDRDVEMTHGVILNQGPHQVDIVRLIGGGMVRSVRAMTGIGDPSRPGEGHYVCFLEFEDGVPACLVFGGYGFLDMAELVGWIGEDGFPKDRERHVKARRFFRSLGKGSEREKHLGEQLEEWRYGGSEEGAWALAGQGEEHQPFFGLTIVSCEKGELRQSPDGLFVYGDQGREEILLEKGFRSRDAEMREFYEAVVKDRPAFHDGRWGEATLEVCLAIIRSARERREILMSHQVPVVDSF
jgi:predicted dehydrogenase